VPLDKVTSPDALKALPAADIPALAQEIREFIVAAVAETGGHLGSNLGAVELTLALHRVFDSPEDILLWDTGHQAYVHKIITGRADRFGQLRQAGGLSGYPSRSESSHDWIENSHASTALSYAFGLARGLADEAGPRRHVVPIVGDGALTGGMAYEALNNIGHAELPCIIVLNDNGRSYAETVSRLSERVSDFRVDPRYRSARRQFDQLVDRFPLVERVRDAGLDALKQVLSDAPALQSFVESLGIRYAGPYDGHDVERLEHAFEAAKQITGPILVHVLTHKGKGYAPAEQDPEKNLHDTSAFEIATGRPPGSKPRSWTQVFSEQMVALADQRPELIALTAAMPGSTGLLPLAAAHPDKVLDVGIAEQHAVTAAAGLAMAGRLPVVAVYSTFFARAFDQANFDVGLHDEHVVFVFDRSGITGDDGPSHHGILDLSLCLRIPTMTILAPSCEQELVAMLGLAMHLDGPVAIRFPKGAVDQRRHIGTGLEANRLRGGTDLAIVAVGDRVQPALEAADLLVDDGIDAAVWDPRAIRPVDPAMLDSLASVPMVVTVENGVVNGGAGSFLADALVERAGVRHAPPVLRLGVPAAYLPQAKPARILAELGLDAAGITASVKKALNGT